MSGFAAPFFSQRLPCLNGREGRIGAGGCAAVLGERVKTLLVNTMRSAVSPACTRFTRMAAVAQVMLSLFPCCLLEFPAPIPQALT